MINPAVCLSCTLPRCMLRLLQDDPNCTGIDDSRTLQVITTRGWRGGRDDQRSVRLWTSCSGRCSSDLSDGGHPAQDGVAAICQTVDALLRTVLQRSVRRWTPCSGRCCSHPLHGPSGHRPVPAHHKHTARVDSGRNNKYIRVNSPTVT